MELEAGVLVPPVGKVPVIEGEIVTAIRELASRGVGSKTIAREVGVARNTVRRYLRRVSERTVQRAVADLRREQRVAALATVRVETPPGEQLQIDFG
jgi:orotate phosphoribosyltransferase-like protein